MAQLVEAIFSGKNALTSVTFTFPRPQFFLEPFPGLMLMYDCCPNIKYLDITKALFFKSNLHVLISSVPNVVDLSLTGIDISKLCNFKQLLKLHRLSLSWVPDLELLLGRLPLQNLRTLNLFTSRAFPSQNLDKLIPTALAGVKIVLVNMRIKKFSVRSYQLRKENKIVVTEDGNDTLIYKL
ncbi:hypothetical protein TKK_0003043 [Trichogramma kaykai]